MGERAQNLGGGGGGGSAAGVRAGGFSVLVVGDRGWEEIRSGPIICNGSAGS